MREVFGARRVPMSSVKSVIGHCMGAASAIEAVSCVETILTGVYPPTVGYTSPDPECDVAVVANTAGRGRADVVVNHSLAFGGYDAVLCSREAGPPPLARGVRSVKPLAITGLGVVSSLGVGWDAFRDAYAGSAGGRLRRRPPASPRAAPGAARRRGRGLRREEVRGRQGPARE